FRPARAVDFVRNLAGTLPEEVYLRKHCQFAPLLIDLEGTTLSGPRLLEGAWGTKSFRRGAGLVGLGPGFAGELRLLKHGVWISTHTLPQNLTEVPPHYLRAVVDV